MYVKDFSWEAEPSVQFDTHFAFYRKVDVTQTRQIVEETQFMQLVEQF